jgi:hypothetical protein
MMPKTKAVTKAEEPHIKKIDWRYAVDIDYDRDEGESDEDGFYRDSRIIRVWVERPPTPAHLSRLALQVAREIAGGGKASPDPILAYCVDRLLSSYRLDPADFEVAIVNGYYGEETGAVTCRRDDEIVEEIGRLAILSPADQVRFTLVSEYGLVLERLEGCSFEVKEIPTSSVFIPNRDYYVGRVDRGRVDLYRERAEWKDFLHFPQCLVGEDMSLVDGYHRLLAWGKRKNITVIAAVGGTEKKES